MNDFSTISAESNLKDDITVRSDEYDPATELNEFEEANRRELNSMDEEKVIEDDTAIDAGWPGDGSGTDDLSDYNANEADDYRNE